MKKGSYKINSEDEHLFNWNDKNSVLSAIQISGKALFKASEKLQDDKEIVLAAVSQDGFSLPFVSERLKDDEEVVMTALKNSGSALKYVSERLKDDEEVVLAAVRNTSFALRYASDRLTSDVAFCLTCAKIDSYTIAYFTGEAASIFKQHSNDFISIEAYLTEQNKLKLQQQANAALLAKLTEYSSNFPNNQLFKRKPL